MKKKEKGIYTEYYWTKESSSFLDIENHGSITFQDLTILEKSIILKKKTLPGEVYPNTTFPSINAALDKPTFASLSDKKQSQENNFAGDIKDLYVNIKSMMRKGGKRLKERLWICIACEKDGMKNVITCHIESN